MNKITRATLLAGAILIGPELTFGVYMQEHVKEPILIIKTAWGGKSLCRDFRRDLKAPEMKVVIGVIGLNGELETERFRQIEPEHIPWLREFRRAMAAPAEMPEFKGKVAAVHTAQYWDPELEELQGRWPKVKARNGELKKQGLGKEEHKAAIDAFLKTVYTDEEWKKMEGVSHACYHYLGSGKIMALIGKGFAETMIASEAEDLLAKPLEKVWKSFSEEPGTGLADVWQVKDGVLVCKGSPRGGIYLDRELADFTLRLEWRWPGKGKEGKGGVLLRTVGPWKLWPKSLEAQINAGGAGDFWGLDGFSFEGPAERLQKHEHPQFGKLIHLPRTAAVEKPAGEWNHYEIEAKGAVVTLKLNGQVVNQATGCDLRPGRICLTAEGNEIQFRNIRLILAPSEK